MSISRDRKTRRLWVSQESYIEKILERFSMHKAKPVSSPLANHFKLSSQQCPSTMEEEMKAIPYGSAIGSLMYVMVCTRPDITHAVGVVSRFISNPRRKHWAAVKWIMRYFRGTTNASLCFGDGLHKLVCYSDADWTGDVDT